MGIQPCTERQDLAVGYPASADGADWQTQIRACRRTSLGKGKWEQSLPPSPRVWGCVGPRGPMSWPLKWQDQGLGELGFREGFRMLMNREDEDVGNAGRRPCTLVQVLGCLQMLIVHPNTFRWTLPWDGMVKGGGKVELNSERMGGWGFASYRFFLPTPRWPEEEIVPLFPKLIKLCCVTLCSCLSANDC